MSAGGPPGAAGDARLLRRTWRRLIFWSGGITLVILVVLGAAIYLAVDRSLSDSTEQRLLGRAGQIAAIVGQTPGQPAGFPQQLPTGLAFGGPSSGTLALVIGPGNESVGPQNSRFDGLPDMSAVEAARKGAVDVRKTSVMGTPIQLVSEPVVRDGQTYVVQIVADRTAEARALQQLVTVLLIGGLAAFGLSVVGGALYARRALVPIRESLRRQREFAADASHELRTPLAVVRGSVEHLQRHPDSTIAEQAETLDDIKAETDHLTQLVESLLLLARADSGAIEIEHQPLDLADATTTALEPLAGLASDKGVTLHLDATPTPTVGDSLRLRQLVTILVDNAIRHSPAGTSVMVTVQPAGDRGVLTVSDQGSGIKAEDLPHVFERFWRAPDAPSGGAGLGLSIAHWIVERHAGTIEATSPVAGGARFEVRLPSR
ncbi:MAG TPA: HAMP domain-containing sensor histidine kinase [Candidatus Limnocylindrales bacterium]|jgi:signal transduction histidine kinase